MNLKLFVKLLFLSLIISNFAHADWREEVRKIDYLLVSVEKSEGLFIRNGSEHSAKDAANHLRRKLKNAQSGWFFYTPKEKWTVQLFIDKIASKSSLSGKSYKIKTKAGKLMNTKDWLENQLKSYRPQK